MALYTSLPDLLSYLHTSYSQTEGLQLHEGPNIPLPTCAYRDYPQNIHTSAPFTIIHHSCKNGCVDHAAPRGLAHHVQGHQWHGRATY